MHIRSQSITIPRVWRGVLTALLAAGLMVATGCDSSGTNGGGDDGGSDTTVPGAPSGLEAGAADAAVQLGWEAPEDAETYKVYRDTEEGVDASGSPLTEGLSETSFTDGSVENGTTYFYVVTAVADEEGDPSGEAVSTPFTVPSELSGQSGDSQIELDWAAAAGAETYNVYRDTEPFEEVSGMDPLTTEIAETSVTDESAENGTKYYYRVTSVNPEDAESAASNEVEKTPFSDPPDRP